MLILSGSCKLYLVLVLVLVLVLRSVDLFVCGFCIWYWSLRSVDSVECDWHSDNWYWFLISF